MVNEVGGEHKRENYSQPSWMPQNSLQDCQQIVCVLQL